MKLSPHFTREEFEFSQTAIRLGLDNTIPPDLMDNAKRTAETLEFIRAILGNRPITVSSGYRSPAVNKAIGGSATSAHMLALACDFICPTYGSVYQTAEVLASVLDDYDQLILEFATPGGGGWIHIGLSTTPQRQEVLTAVKENGKTKYLHGLVF